MHWLTLRQLKSKQVSKRREAAAALGQNPTAISYRALLAAAKTDDDDEVRRLAAVAIGKIEDDCRIKGLIDLLRDRHPEVQKAALAGLKSVREEGIVPVLTPLLRHADPGVRGYAATLLQSRGWRPTNAEEEISFHIALGQPAKAALHGAAAIPAIENAIQTGTYNQRVAAVEALGKIDDKRAIKPLLGALQSNDPAVCAAAVAALGAIGDAQNHQALVNLLQHADGHVRAVTAETLGRLAGGRAVDALLPMLRDPVWDVRRATASALGKIKDRRAVESLNATLQDEDADVREAVALALSSMNDRRAIAPLVMALTDSTSGVRRIATAALSRIDEDWSRSAEAQSAVEALRPALQHNDPQVRFMVASLLGSLGVHSPETDVLLPNESPTSTSENRRKLAASLFLVMLADHDSLLRQAAAESLGQLGEHRATASLQRALRDTDAGVRLAAEQALTALKQVEAPA